MRLVIVLLFLVVLPTAILSLVAGRSIQSREILLHQRLERNAFCKIETIGDKIDVLIQADSKEVIGAFQETVLSGMHTDCMDQKLEILRKQSNFIKNAYLFMNPWNFIFPRTEKLTSQEVVTGRESRRGGLTYNKKREDIGREDFPTYNKKREDVCRSRSAGFPTENVIDKLPQKSLENDSISREMLLKQELIKQISVGMKSEFSDVSFVCDGSSYCFKSVSGMTELYAGFEIDMDGVIGRLESMLKEYSTDGVILRIASINGKISPDLGREVLITDSFNPQPSPFYSSVSGFGEDEAALAAGRLPVPLSHIQISAFLVDKSSISKAEALESRLIKWGILLLAIVIVTSSTILIRKTMNQADVARRRSEFVIGMSHDLRTPVAAMRILADSLAAGRVEDPEKQKKFLSTISTECERLGDMIERVLFFFKQEHGAMTYTMQPFDIGAMVRSIVNSVEARSAGRMSVKLEIDDSLPEVSGDVDAIGKVITNLLDNALKYGGRFGSGAPPWLEYANTHTRPAEEHQNLRSEFEDERLKEEHQNLRSGFEDERLKEEHQNLCSEFEDERLKEERQNLRSEFEDEKLSAKGGSARGGKGEPDERGGYLGTHKGSPYVVRVFGKRWRGRDWVVVSVADQGMGIPISEQKKIFRRFYRVDTVIRSHVGGIGIGLSLCADIVRAHRGRLTVKSELGRGAEFSIWLRGDGVSLLAGVCGYRH